MGFLRKIRGLSLLDREKSYDICLSLITKSLPTPCKKIATALVWPCETRMFHKQPAKQLTDAFVSGKRPRGRPRTCSWNYVEDLSWSRLGIPRAKLPLVTGNRDTWRFQLKLLPRYPKRTSAQREIH